ncbi:hypothetical protein N7508_001975 [Penicillium antarcticum]|nr:uncharacterized protein N7508_001975 [Penicillium antarcticum]KAJ5317467.1 hypothetical protein N7508_001975 [Penicillium antarcticum]
MQLLSIFSALALPPAVISSPKTGSSLAACDDERGNYVISGLGARKQQVIGAGGNTHNLAIAMLETDIMTTDYTYGNGKTGDAPTLECSSKIRTCCTPLRLSSWGFLGKSASRFPKARFSS